MVAMPGAIQETVRTTAEGELRGSCVAVLPNEKPVRLYGDTPGEFLETLARSSLAWVNFGVDDLKGDGSQIASLLGFSGTLVEVLLESAFTNYEDRETELGLRLPAVNVRGGDLDATPLLVLVRWGLVLTLHKRGKVNRMARLAKRADAFMRKIPADRAVPDKLTILLNRILNDNNERNFDALRYIQTQGDQVGAALLQAGSEREGLAKQVYDVKHLLVEYLDQLWASLDVISNLRYGDAELITDDETLLARVGILADDIQRQIQLSEHTTEVLVSGLEVLQSMYNNQLQELNNRLAMAFTWLTILGTVILVPNTIATVFGPFTDYSGASLVGYFAMILVATLTAVWASWRWIRRMDIITTRRGP